MSTIKIKRVYDKPSNDDGYRILIDRVWPRGISKKEAKLDEWNKVVAPSAGLREWFGHTDDRFDEFEKRYRHELRTEKDELKRLKKIASKQKLTLLYGAKNETHNQAVVLQKILMSGK
jgi:uncharacterized protein YeaO (DUF488 family)